MTVTGTATSATHTATLGLTVNASGGGPIVSGGIYEILQGSQAVDDPASSTTPGTQLIVYGAHGGPNQRWTFTANSDGAYSVKNGYSGLCIDVAGASTTAGAQIVRQTCATTASQHWTVAAGGAPFGLVDKLSGLVVTVSGTADSSTLTQQANTDTALQLWTFTKVG